MKIDFIATAITAWHILGVKAYLLKLKEEKARDITGLIYIEPHPKNGILIKNSMLIFPEGVNCIRINNKDNLYEYLEKGKSTELKVLAPNFPDIMLCHKIYKKLSIPTQAVVIDEGVGCYDTSKIRWFKSIYIDTRSIMDPVKFFARRGYENLLRKIDDIKVQYFTLFNYCGSKLEKNQEACEFYARILDQQKGAAIPVDKKPYVIMFTNPLEEEGNVSGEDLKKLYHRIADIINRNGYAFFVRIHPRENLLDKYEGLNLLTVNADSSETLLARLETKPIFVLGAHSTSLITAKLFFGIEAITLGNMISPISKTEYCRDLIRKYESNFKKIVEFPEDIEALTTYIRNARK